MPKADLGSKRWQWGQNTCSSGMSIDPELRNSLNFTCHFSSMSFQYLKPKMVFPAPVKSKADRMTSSASTSSKYCSRSRLSKRCERYRYSKLFITPFPCINRCHSIVSL